MADHVSFFFVMLSGSLGPENQADAEVIAGQIARENIPGLDVGLKIMNGEQLEPLDALDLLPVTKRVRQVTKSGGTGFKGSKGFELKNAPFPKVRNSPTTINGRDFSGHALDQMQNRGIMPSVVENTLKTGTSFPTRAGTSGVFDPVNKIRVITNSETGRVVTVIRGVPK